MIAPEVLVGAALAVSLLVYALTAGADFGGGVWDLLASKGELGVKQRKVIAEALAPIWEANHVWLILIIVLLFVDFPQVFAAITTALHIPLSLMLMGIVLRGSAFVFRSYGLQSDEVTRRWGTTFAMASVVTPIMLGITFGAVTSGSFRLTPGTSHVQTDFVQEWVAPYPLALGLFCLVLFALLAAVYLILETEDVALRESFRLRALVSAAAVGVLAFATLAVAKSGAPHLFEHLMHTWWSLPFQLATGSVALSVFWTLWTRRYRAARLLVMLQVACLLTGMVGAQYPYLLPPAFTLEVAAAPDNVLWWVLGALGAGVVLLLPSLYVLFWVFKRRRLA